MRAVVSIADVVALNEALAQAGVAAKVHLHDACGGQSLWLEPLEGAGGDDLPRAREVVEGYLTGRRVRLGWSDDGVTFWPL